MRTAPYRGRWAEDEAARHLQERGYRLEARNVRLAGGEIDLIARDGQVLVFVEVKARKDPGRGLAAVSADKRQRVARAAAAWIGRHGVPPGGCRFDVVAVTGRGSNSQLEHVTGAFESPRRWAV